MQTPGYFSLYTKRNSQEKETQVNQILAANNNQDKKVSKLFILTGWSLRKQVVSWLEEVTADSCRPSLFWECLSKTLI